MQGSYNFDTLLGMYKEGNEPNVVLTNPPYVTTGSSNLKEEISKNLTLRNHYKINAIGVEGLFME